MSKPNLLPAGYIWYGLLLNIFYLVAIADVTSIDFLGGKVRWAWAALPLLILLVPNPTQGNPKGMLSLTSLFFLTHVFASILSDSALKGLLYSAWIGVNYIFFFRAAYLLTVELQQRVWSALLIGGRIQIVLAIALVLLHVHDRARFIYFEPSYLAIGLVPYLFTAIFWSRRRWFDWSLLFGLIICNQSANMMIAIAVAVVFWLITNRRNFISILILGLGLVVASAIFWVSLNDPANPNHGVASWVANHGLSEGIGEALLGRAGNRIPRMQAAVEMLDGHWLSGFGPGVYEKITENQNFEHLSGGLKYLDPAGLPVINVWIEATTNAGLPAAAVLLATFFYLAYLAYSRISNQRERCIMFGALLAWGVMLQLESSYLRAYIWLAFGVFAARSLRQEPAQTLPK